MARRSILIAILILSSLLLGACSADRGSVRDGRRQMNIGMEGAADTLVAPDHVVWAVTMQDLDPELQAAKRSSDLKLGAVLAALEGVDSVDGSLSLGAARVERQVQFCNGGDDRVVQFLVKRTVTFRQDDLGGVDATLDKLVSSADVEVASHYEVSDPEAVLRELRKRALDQARAKTVSLAAHAGLTVGELCGMHVNEQDYRHRHHNRQRVELTGVAGAEARHMETRVRANYEVR